MTLKIKGFVDPRLVSNAAGSERDARRARKHVEAYARARGLLPKGYQPKDAQ